MCGVWGEGACGGGEGVCAGKRRGFFHCWMESQEMGEDDTGYPLEGEAHVVCWGGRHMGYMYWVGPLGVGDTWGTGWGP